MKTQQKNVLWIVLTAILAYVIGAFVGLPFAQKGLTSGDLGGIRRANKQQELVNSPSDLKLAEKYQADSNYRNALTAGYGILYVQTKATLATIESLKKETGSVKELASYSVIMDEINEVGTQLASMLESGLQGLKAVGEKKSADNLTFKLSQSLNLFQLMNSRLADLEEFSEKTQLLGEQKKINDDVLKTYSEFLVESSDIASSCGDNARAKRTLGFFGKTAGVSSVSMAAAKDVALNYAAMAGNVNMVSNCGQKAAGIVKDSFLHLSQAAQAVGQRANESQLNYYGRGEKVMHFNMSRSNDMSLSISKINQAGQQERSGHLFALTTEMNNAVMGLTVGSDHLKSQTRGNGQIGMSEKSN